MFFVILVHLCQQSSYSVIKSMAQFFISGVTIFILLTGYIYGEKALRIEYPGKISRWGLNRAKRILIPYYLAVTLVLILDVILINARIEIGQIFMLAVCIQDLCGDYFYHIKGTGHLWYITMLVFSYISISFCFVVRKKLLLSVCGGRCSDFYILFK